MLRISFDQLLDTLGRALAKTGMPPDRTDRCARLIAETTLDGVTSHGINRFERFLRMIENGNVDVHATPERVEVHGALERWNGRKGPGNLNAQESMARAIALSRAHGLGCVALANTNHWMRGGSYGWQAAEAGALAICWTNTLPNLPPWGASEPRLGNNPLVIAVPRPPAHIVVDTAMSQFSFGALESYRRRGQPLPVDGGYDARGELTSDAAAIEATGRVLPIGYWKGSGLSLLLDLVAATLSGGNAAWQIPRDSESETGVSQVFIAFDANALGGTAAVASIADAVLRYTQQPDSSGARARYPGERAFETRQKHLAGGIPVDADVWAAITSLAT